MITPIGTEKENFWRALINGKVAFKEVTTFDTSEFFVHRGAEVKDFLPQSYIKKANINKIGRASQFAIAATQMALADAKLDLSNISPEKIGVCFGTTMGEQQILEEIDVHLAELKPEEINTKSLKYCPSNVISSNVAIEFNFKGPNTMIPTACAAGNYAIGWSYDLLRLRRVGVMIAGGVDPFTRGCFTGFARLGVLAPEVCQPFDKDRKGLIIGEGAGVMVLEPLEHALSRNAPIYAEVGGYGLSCDAYHATQPDGYGAQKAMENALTAAEITPTKINYINAHGTGTTTNDRVETLAVKKVFGDKVNIPISSIKSMIGHTLGAASAIEAITCCLAIQNNIVPPTMNYCNPDPECDLDVVPNTAREHNISIAMSNSYGFGGNNSSLILKKFKG